MGRNGRRGMMFPQPTAVATSSVGARPDPGRHARTSPPALAGNCRSPTCAALSASVAAELGMMGISLFGTCTMKYNSRLNEALAARPELAEVHSAADETTLRGGARDHPPVRLHLGAALGHGPIRLPGPAGGARMPPTRTLHHRAWLAAGRTRPRDEIVTSCRPIRATRRPLRRPAQDRHPAARRGRLSSLRR